MPAGQLQTMPMCSCFSYLEGDPVNGKDVRSLVKGLGSILRSKRRKALMALDTLSVDPNDRALMIHAGAIAMLSKLLDKRNENSMVVLSILSSMACDNTRARKELLDARIIPYVVRIAVSGSTDATCKGLSLLYYLSIEERGLHQLLDSGLFDELVFWVHLGRTEYQEWVFKLLGNLIQRFPISLSPRIQASAVQTLIDLACNASSDMKVHFIRLLTVILESSSSDFAGLFSSEGLEMLVAALTPISGDSECGQWAIIALSAVSSCSECARVLASQICIDPIIKMLWQDSDIVKEHALRVISDLTKFPAGIEQELLSSLDILPTFLSSEYHVLQEWSARILGNIAALDDCVRLKDVYCSVMIDLFLGLESPNRYVTLSFLQAIRQILDSRNSLHSYVADFGDLCSLIRACVSGTLDVDILEASLSILSDLCIARDNGHGILVGHSVVEHLLEICGSPHLCDIVEPSLRLLSMLVSTDVGLAALQRALDSSNGWKVLSDVLRRNKASWSCHVLDIITRIISKTTGEIHTNLLGNEIDLIVQSIKSSSLPCQKSGVHTIVSLVESSPVYSAQVVSSGILPVLVGLIESSNPELANPAAKALGGIALGDREHKDLIAEARALPALIQWLLNGEYCDTIRVLKALCHIVENHEENCNVLVSGNVDKLAALLVSEVNTVTSDAPFSTVLLLVVCRTWKPGVLGTCTENTVAKVLINLHEMATREQELWQNRVLFSSRMLLSSALVLDNHDLESAAELTVTMMDSRAEAVRHGAGDILREVVSKLKYIPECVRAVATEMLVLFLKATGGVLCEEALDLLLEQHEYDDRKAACFSNAGGIRVLVEIMTIGTNTCKAKSALLVSSLSGVSHEFCSEAIRFGIVKPLVILLAMEDSSCRTAAGEALLRLLGKDFADLDHQERVQVIKETLDSKGCEFEDEIALMRNFDAFNIPSSGSDQYFDCEQPQKSDSEEETQEINGSPSFAEDHLLCPITHEVMFAPVMAADGYVYERDAIAAWFKNHATSPMTNLELPCLDLIPIDDMEEQIALLSR